MRINCNLANFPFSMSIYGFMTFLLIHFVSPKGERKKWQQGHKWAAAASALSLKLVKFFIRKRGGHRNGQIDQNSTINCGIQGNAKVSSNIKIYSILKAFLNSSSGFRDTESWLSS